MVRPLQHGRRSCVSLLPLLLIVLWQTSAKISDEKGAPSTYVAILRGDQVVPPVNTTAHGEVDFIINHRKKAKDDFTTYNISLFQVDHLTEVNMRQAQPGQPGAKIATLWGPSPNGLNQQVNGVLKVGNLTKSDFNKGPMNNKDMNELMQRFNDNAIYVLVTTTDHPDGLLRGQVQKKNETTSG